MLPLTVSASALSYPDVTLLQLLLLNFANVRYKVSKRSGKGFCYRWVCSLLRRRKPGVGCRTYCQIRCTVPEWRPLIGEAYIRLENMGNMSACQDPRNAGNNLTKAESIGDSKWVIRCLEDRRCVTRAEPIALITWLILSIKPDVSFVGT